MPRSRRSRNESGALDARPRPVGTADLERRTVTALVYAVVVIAALFTLAGAAYVGLGFGFLIELWLAHDDATRGWLGDLPVWLLLALVPTWVGDTVAYLAGSRIGRNKIAPTISPGKTWEGTLAGF